MKRIPSNYIALTVALGLAPFAAGEVKLHPELEAAAAKVDTAGSFFEVDLFKEDLDMLMPYTELLGEMLTELTGDETPVDFRRLLESSGLLDSSAIARSNARHGTSWLNKTYLSNGGSRKGLFSLVAADRREFQVARMAPSNTDLALEVRADFTQLPGLIKSIGGGMGISKEATGQLDKEVKNLGMTVGEALGRSTFTLQLAMVFDSVSVGGGTSSVEPKEMLARMDGMTWFWNLAGEAFLEESRSANNLDFTRSEKEGAITYTITSEGHTRPGVPAVIVVEADTLWLSSSSEFLEKSRKGDSPLADDPGFQAAWSGMPEAGNAMAYVSPQLFGACIVDGLEMIGSVEVSGETGNATDRLLAKIAKDLVAADVGLAFSLSPDESGFLAISKLPVPGRYLDDILAGDLLFELLADPELLAITDVAVTLPPEELDAVVKESRNEARKAIQAMGLDEETTKRILDNMEKELRKDLGGLEGAGGQVGEQLKPDIEVPELLAAEVEAAIEEAVAETRATLQESGLDEAVINEILKTTKEETRQEMLRFLKSEGKEMSGE